MDYSYQLAYCALMEVSRREGTPLDEVIRSIDEAIQQARCTATEEQPDILNAWQQIPCAGTIPTAVELVTYLACPPTHRDYAPKTQSFVPPLS